MTIVPDDKDWTWVLERPCHECGFAADGVDRDRVGATLRAMSLAWQAVLARPDAASRPAPAVWSPLEYACHVRDVHRVFGGRLDRMISEEHPRFANWDQDTTAVEERYGEQDPQTVGTELTTSAEQLAARFEAVTEAQWSRTGARSDGAVFTVDTLSRYVLHDLVHHLWDVGEPFEPPAGAPS
jgi:hypothetical protein